jgi:AraC-like DNA-binding protein
LDGRHGKITGRFAQALHIGVRAEEPGVAILALRQAAPLALAADAPAAPRDRAPPNWSTAAAEPSHRFVADISEPITRPGDLLAKPWSDRAELAPLLESCFADLNEAMDDNNPAIAGAAIRTITQLALIERGVVRPRSQAARSAVRAGRLSLAKRLIAHHIARARLSPAFVANLLGISVRHLHVLFEVAPLSFAQTVTTLRIAQSRLLLRKAPAVMIADIAPACGFDSIATYYRVFRAHEGMTPGDFRDATRGATCAMTNSVTADHLTAK